MGTVHKAVQLIGLFDNNTGAFQGVKGPDGREWLIPSMVETSNYSDSASGLFTSAGALVNPRGRLDSSINYSAPSDGFSYTIIQGVYHTVLKPAAALASGTINLPVGPANGEMHFVSFTQAVTALTINGNGKSMSNGQPTAVQAGQTLGWIYRSADTTWYRIQ